jgi:hypothetical protein
VLGIADELHGAFVGLVGRAAAYLGQRLLGLDGELEGQRPGGLGSEPALDLGELREPPVDEHGGEAAQRLLGRAGNGRHGGLGCGGTGRGWMGGGRSRGRGVRVAHAAAGQ